MPRALRALVVAAEILTLLLTVLGVCLVRRDRQKPERCSQKTMGRVTGYVSGGGKRPALPVVEYQVDGVSYVGRLRYTGFVSTNARRHGAEREIVGDPAGPVLHVRGSAAARSPLEKLWPVDAELPVSYNPQKPKEHIVLRYAKSPVGWRLVWAGLGAAAAVTVAATVSW